MIAMFMFLNLFLCHYITQNVLHPEIYPYVPARSSLPECFAHGAIRQVSEARECKKASSAAKNVKEEDANADKGEAAEARRFLESQGDPEYAKHENDKIARRQKRKEKKEAAAAAAREAARVTNRAAENAAWEKELQQRRAASAAGQIFNEWEVLRHIEGGQELKERHGSSWGDERDAAYREIMNKLNSLGVGADGNCNPPQA